MSDGLSMVYSFFDPALSERSLGTYMILDHIRRAKERGLPHVYLGYWVKGSRKMGYKTKFFAARAPYGPRLGALFWRARFHQTRHGLKIDPIH